MVHLLLLLQMVLLNSDKVGGSLPLPFIIIFGLRQREDRWKRCKEIVEREGLQAKFYKVEPNFADPHRQSTKDFLEMLRSHQHNLLFFENDFELTENWREVIDRSRRELPLNWDMLYLGCNLTTNATRLSDNLARVNGAWMMHAVMLSERFIKEVLKSYNPNQFWVFDEWCRKVALNRQFYMTLPMISYQRNSFSDFAGAYVEYDIFSNHFYNKL